MSRFIATFLITIALVEAGFSQYGSPDSLLYIVSLNRRDSAHITALARLAQIHRGKDNNKAFYYSLQILKLPDIHPPQTAKANITIGLIYSDRGLFDSAAAYFQAAEEIANTYPDDKNLRSVLYNGLGLLYKKQGDNDRALTYYKLVDELGEAGLGKENVAGNYVNIANIYGRMGNRREAIRYLFLALPVFESINNSKGMSYCYNNLGLLLKQQGNVSEAEKYLTKSLELKEKEGDLKGIANSCNELALLFMDKNDFVKAIGYVDRTIELSEKLESRDLLVTGLINKGKILRIEGKLDEASKQFMRAKPLTENLPNHFLLASLETEKGKLYAEKKQNEQAIQILLSGIRQAELSSNVEAKVNAHLFLSQAYSSQNMHEEALTHFKKYHQLNDSINGNKLKLDYKTLETQYEVEKKNAEIALLKKDQELQARTVERQRAVNIGFVVGLLSIIIISAILINRHRVVNQAKRQLEVERVRNNIARDLHDDIGSTMSSINIVSQMALQQANGSAEHFRKIADQSSALMERMSDIVWSIHPANDSLQMVASRIREFTAEILESKNIRYSFFGFDSLNGEILEVEKRKNVFLICKEAVNNAAKYSDASEVRITFLQAGKTLTLEVSDNGKGFDVNQSKKGNGLNNIMTRAKSLNGTVEIQSRPSNGTTIRLVVSLT